jgi:tetratricopeptide (TPR) repeat protein
VTGTHALATLGTVELRRGDFRQAAVYLQQALDDSRELGNHRFSYALSVLGMVRLAEGDHEQSFRLLQQALDQSRATSDRVVETHTLNCLGEAWLAAGRPGQALAAHAEALILAEETGNSYEQARAHRGRARAHQAAGDDIAEIRRQQHAALAIYAELGAPEADEIRAEMAAVRPADAS